MELKFTNSELLLFCTLLLVGFFQVRLSLRIAALGGVKFLTEHCFSELTELRKETMEVRSAVDIAGEARKIAQNTEIELQAIKKSTHTVIPVGDTKNVEALEKKFRQVAGIPNEDFDSDLEHLGFHNNISPQKAEDLV